MRSPNKDFPPKKLILENGISRPTEKYAEFCLL